MPECRVMLPIKVEESWKTLISSTIRLQKWALRPRIRLTCAPLHLISNLRNACVKHASGDAPLTSWGVWLVAVLEAAALVEAGEMVGTSPRQNTAMVEAVVLVESTGQAATAKATAVDVAALEGAAAMVEAAPRQDAAMVEVAALVEAAGQASTAEAAAALITDGDNGIGGGSSTGGGRGKWWGQHQGKIQQWWRQ
jgi:hypothetical protein